MALKGYSQMAITGWLSSPTFNLMIGLGWSLLISNLDTKKPVSFYIFTNAAI